MALIAAVSRTHTAHSPPRWLLDTHTRGRAPRRVCPIFSVVPCTCHLLLVVFSQWNYPLAYWQPAPRPGMHLSPVNELRMSTMGVRRPNDKRPLCERAHSFVSSSKSSDSYRGSCQRRPHSSDILLVLLWGPSQTVKWFFSLVIIDSNE